MLKFLNNLWGYEPSRNRDVVPSRQATQSGGIRSLESIVGLLKSLKIRAQQCNFYHRFETVLFREKKIENDECNVNISEYCLLQ